MIWSRLLALAIGLVALPAMASGHARLRIPLGFDVFYALPGTAAKSVEATRVSVVQAKLIPSTQGAPVLYVRGVALGATKLTVKGAAPVVVEVDVVPPTESEFGDFVTQELAAGRIVEPLPLVVGEPPSVLYDDVLGTVVCSDETRLRITKKKQDRGRTMVSAVAVAPGWATLTIFDGRSQVARRFAFHLRAGTTAVAPSPAAEPTPTFTEAPPSAVTDPPALVLMTLPLHVGAIVPFVSPIPAIAVEPRASVEYRRLSLPAGRQALYLIPRATGPAIVRVTNGKGGVLHEFRVRVVAADGAALVDRCDVERREQVPCEAVRAKVGELKIVGISAPIGSVVSSDRELLRYARRVSGSDPVRDISLQVLGPGVTDLNLFDEQGGLRRRLLLRLEGPEGYVPNPQPTPVGVPPVVK